MAAPTRPAPRCGTGWAGTRRSVVGTSETKTSGPAAADTAAGIEAGLDLEGRSGQERPGDDRQPAHVAEGQAGQPPVAVGSTPRRALVAARRGGHRGVGQHDPLGPPGRAAGGHHQGVARLDRPAARPRGASAGVDDGARRQGRDQALAGRRRQPLVEREHGVARVPRPSQGGHERRTAREVEGDERSHGAREPPGTIGWVRASTDGVKASSW